MFKNSSLLFTVVSLAFLVFSTIAGKDYYKLLGVDRDADNHQIKKAYKKLSKKYHPDKNKAEDAHEKFIEYTNAYQVLTDPEKRDVYDRYGEEGLKNEGGGGHGFDPHDIFAQFFGGGDMFGGGMFGGGRRTKRQKPMGPTINLDLHLSLEELYHGKEVDIDVSKQKICSHCGGSGAESPDDISQCDECDGSGMKVVRRILGPGIVQQMQTTCTKCHGVGKATKKKCHLCKGERVIRGNDQVNFDISAGTNAGHQVTIESEADEHPDHETGNLVFKVLEIPHRLFTRKNENLYLDVDISLLESLTGFKRKFRHLNGKTIDLVHTDVVPNGHIEEMKNLGMPSTHNSDTYGSLYVKYWVKFPKSVSSDVSSKLKIALASNVEYAGAIGMPQKPVPKANPESEQTNKTREHDEL
ncbi:DnaJ-like protein [Smittium culicis]|uniref:DnaJ-like protein n=1 Tax=Smittium culicis TaxID=133412 RepID=A0A1R1Y522_9FUNG|nr:DnaJ-like protein [Smittium culicis]